MVEAESYREIEKQKYVLGQATGADKDQSGKLLEMTPTNNYIADAKQARLGLAVQGLTHHLMSVSKNPHVWDGFEVGVTWVHQKQLTIGGRSRNDFRDVQTSIHGEEEQKKKGFVESLGIK